MTLGRALRRYRLRHHLLQKELAARIGISLKHYSMIENGHSFPSSVMLARICRIARIRVIFRNEPERKNSS
jgi:transcriptional regulator with XRE-family HTH domain